MAASNEIAVSVALTLLLLTISACVYNRLREPLLEGQTLVHASIFRILAMLLVSPLVISLGIIGPVRI